jgi:hypothetical protein
VCGACSANGGECGVNWIGLAQDREKCGCYGEEENQDPIQNQTVTSEPFSL